MRGMQQRTVRRLALAGALLVVLAGGGLAFLARAQAGEGAGTPFTHRIALGRDLVRLSIVAMANQTPIAQADARAVLPVLQAIKAQDRITEANAADLDRRLQQALSSDLKEALRVVRLPEPRPEMVNRAREFATRRNLRNPAKYGPASYAFDRLLEFFQQTAK